MEVWGEFRLVENAVAIYFFRRDDGRLITVEPLPFMCKVKAHEPDVYVNPTDASMLIERAAAERLMTELWKVGIRPQGENVERPGEVAAIKYHLEDMRTLVFKAGPSAPNP